MNKNLWRPVAVTVLLVGAAALGGCNKNPDGAAGPGASPSTPSTPATPGTGATPGSGSGGSGTGSGTQ
ncbi:hypothetical protein [Polaromonas sp.]|uniref:hypothetical protein n=1 Tax=Polaromonas sp. TaxID=1869339 RepID=UPI003CC1FA60